MFFIIFFIIFFVPFFRFLGFFSSLLLPTALNIQSIRLSQLSPSVSFRCVIFLFYVLVLMLLEQLNGLVEVLAYVVDQEPTAEASHGADKLDLLEDRPLLCDLNFYQPLHHHLDALLFLWRSLFLSVRQILRDEHRKGIDRRDGYEDSKG